MAGRKRGEIGGALARGRDRFEAWRRSRQAVFTIPAELSSLNSNRHRQRYVREGRERTGCHATSHEADGEPLDASLSDPEPMAGSSCPTCGEKLESLEHVYRTSWRDVFGDRRTCPAWYRT
ncbi:MAG: hypothetical protein RIK87_20060 [Fuerstiella sp.]